MFVRPEREEEREIIDALIETAFAANHGAETGAFMRGFFVAERRQDTFIPSLSLAALTEGGAIAGHTALYKTDIITPGSRVTQLALSHCAVLPEHRGRGVMRLLVTTALDKARDAGWKVVFLGGDPALYGRFGFEPSYKFGIYHENRKKWGDEGFLVCRLAPDALEGISGATYYYGG